MDSHALLQDLHFKISSSDSAHITRSKRDSGKESNFQFDEEDRTQMTAKWVAHLRNRQRSLSSDSYFGTETVCDKLKKSFLKPSTVTEEDMEDLRMKLDRMDLKDSDFSMEDFKLVQVETQMSGFSERSMSPLVSKASINLNFDLKNERRLSQRFRSKTVPLYQFIFNDVCSNANESSLENDKQHETATCNLPCARLIVSSKHSVDLGQKQITTSNFASLRSVDLIKDILFDENLNEIAHFVPASDTESIRKANQVLNASIAESFRSENLFPSPTELKNPKLNFKLCPNKIVGCYENEEDYLKTQFYLLKEDFIGPLREGIEDYRKSLKRGTIPVDVKNLKLHHNVRVIEPLFKEDKLGLAIDMGFPLSEKIGDKDFMDGSLVLITPNHFKDVYVGTVLSHKFMLPLPEEAVRLSGRNRRRQSNILMVQLHGASHFDPAFINQKVLLAESQTFFQPYYYVMKIFQGMGVNDLPLKEYIVGSKSNAVIASPSYLPRDAEYLLEDNVKVNVANNATWPGAEVLNLNDSQLCAFKKALSEKLVLIQGPPGTGKTYLGCKVAKALLQNRHVWNKDGNQPMLLMCQTNHALDQFMELLLPISRKLIRIGCQSKSDILAPYNIREWVRKGRFKSPKQLDAMNLKRDLKTISSNIQVCRLELIRIVSYGILDLQTLVSMGVMDLKHAGCFIGSDHFLMWLEARESKVSHGSKEKHENKENTSGCSKHEKSSMAAHSQKVTPTYGSDDLSSTLAELNSGSSSMRNILIKYIISFPDYEKALKEQKLNTPQSRNQMKEMENRLIFLKHCVSGNIKNESEHVKAICLWTVAPHIRWVLYRSWAKKVERVLQSQLQLLESHYLSTSSAYAELKQFEKLDAMRKAEMIGMTTSAAARLYPVLRELHCPIALVEEAAEVHEAHIVATVTKHCQHLILLGDHKQLRPRPASYALSKTHFTDVSLFERLILNEAVSVNTLLTQHRMRPQISALIRPSIYPKLYDHDCTKNRQNVLNMRKNVFFFSHCWQESKNHVTGSYSNSQEAKMAVQLLRYLLLRDEYNVNEICILTAYREQVNELEANCQPYPELAGVRLLTVDNFQGEESRIVILSLVRNNYHKQIGFLNIENRVCVALSRARDGLFILGNIKLLSHNSELWMSVYKVLKSNALVGPSLPLSCKQHPQNQSNFSQPDDLFQYINSGGCKHTCLFKLSCGHLCRRKCHSNDVLHMKYRCQEPCQKLCAFGHKCNKKCSDKCGDCDCLDWKQLACGHWALTRCSLEHSKYLCEVAVRKCMEPCSHLVNVQCWMPPVSNKYCPNQCPALLKCGHRCPVRCNALRHPNHHKVKCC